MYPCSNFVRQESPSFCRSMSTFLLGPGLTAQDHLSSPCFFINSSHNIACNTAGSFICQQRVNLRKICQVQQGKQEQWFDRHKRCSREWGRRRQRSGCKEDEGSAKVVKILDLAAASPLTGSRQLHTYRGKDQELR